MLDDINEVHRNRAELELALVVADPEEGAGLAELVLEGATDETRRDDGRARGGERVLKRERVARDLFQIDHRIRDAVAGGVDFLKNVAVLRAQEGRDLTRGRRDSFLLTMQRRAPEEFWCGARMVVGKLTELRIVPVSRKSINVSAAMEAEFSSASSVGRRPSAGAQGGAGGPSDPDRRNRTRTYR